MSKPNRGAMLALLHSLILGTYPLLFLLERNPGQATIADSAETFVWVGLIICGTLIIFWWLFGCLRRSAIAASLLWLICLLYGPSVKAVLPSAEPAVGLGLSVLAVSWLEVLIALSVLLLYLALLTALKRAGPGTITLWTQILVALSCILGAMPLAGLGLRAARQTLQTPAHPTVSAMQAQAAIANLPDVYYIILDGYARHDILKTYFGVDNSQFLAALRAIGFWVATDSRSNYGVTLPSLASSLNAEYLEQMITPWLAESTDQTPLMAALKRAAVVNLFARSGHQIRTYPSSYAPTELAQVDYTYKDARTNLFAAFGLGYIQFPWLRGAISETLHQRYRSMILGTIEALAKEGSLDGPKFVFAHIISPHPPFVFKRDGSLLPPSRVFSQGDGDHYGEPVEYRQRYGDQLQFISDQLLAALRNIVGQSRRPPIIVLQSDHGSGLRTELRSRSGTDFTERFANLTAILAPREIHFPESITPVNIFRIIIGHNSANPPPLLKDSSYYAPLARPYDLQDVTSLIRPGPIDNTGPVDLRPKKSLDLNTKRF